jgi:D-alanyl-D-alanine carboxypeptidase
LSTQVETPPADYVARVAAIHRELGIPQDYSARHGLHLQPEAARLEAIGTDIFDRPQQLAPHAAAGWFAMRAQAQQDGIVLLVVSAFRGLDYQRDLIVRKLASGQRLDDILKVNTAPGYSEHHTGCALDLTAAGYAPLEISFDSTEAFDWLARHAERFGFRLSYPRGNPHGIAYEPWHWACLNG